MSILNYFSRKKPVDRGIFVPSVSQTSSSLSTQAIVSANNEVEKSQTSTTASTSVTRFAYSATQRASIGKYTAIHGPTAASRHFSVSCGH